MDQGADIITQHTDSTAALQAAADRGIYAFGQASDMIKFAPSTQLTAILDNWGAYYVMRTADAMMGTWKGGGDTWHGMKEGMVGLFFQSKWKSPVTKINIGDCITTIKKELSSIKGENFHQI